MYYKEIGTLQDAKKAKLIQLTVWLFKHDLQWLINERSRIGENNERHAMIVNHSNAYALYVDDVTGRFANDSDYEFNPNCVGE